MSLTIQNPHTTLFPHQNYSNGNNEELKIQLGKKNSLHLRNDDGNQSPVANLITQVSRTKVASPALGYTPSSPDSSSYATPVAGNGSTPVSIDTSKKSTPTTYSDDDALDMNAIQFSVSTPQTPSTRTPATPVNKTSAPQTTQQPSPKRNKLLSYLLKSISWCFSTNQQQLPEPKPEDDVEEVEETTVTTKTVMRRTSKTKKEDETDEVEVEEESWSSKRLTTTKKKKASIILNKTPSTPTANGSSSAAAPTAGRTMSTKSLHAKALLGEQPERVRGKKCLVLDLDETLVHSCFQPIPNPDFVIPIEIEGTRHMVYVLKRPFVDDFLLEMSKHYEIVIFTASLSKYANPLLDQLDKYNVITARLFREHCTFIDNCYIKDLSRLGRDITQSLIIDNSPTCYALQPQNAMAVSSWFDDKKDTQLQQMIPWLVKMADQPTVYDTLQEYRMYYSQNGWQGSQNW
jgi:Dullard-like phosphatase family protein